MHGVHAGLAAVPGSAIKSWLHVPAREKLQVRPALLDGHGQQLMRGTPWWVGQHAVTRGRERSAAGGAGSDVRASNRPVHCGRARQHPVQASLVGFEGRQGVMASPVSVWLDGGYFSPGPRDRQFGTLRAFGKGLARQRPADTASMQPKRWLCRRRPRTTAGSLTQDSGERGTRCAVSTTARCWPTPEAWIFELYPIDLMLPAAGHRELITIPRRRAPRRASWLFPGRLGPEVFGDGVTAGRTCTRQARAVRARVVTGHRRRAAPRGAARLADSLWKSGCRCRRADCVPPMASASSSSDAGPTADRVFCEGRRPTGAPARRCWLRRSACRRLRPTDGLSLATILPACAAASKRATLHACQPPASHAAGPITSGARPRWV